MTARVAVILASEVGRPTATALARSLPGELLQGAVKAAFARAWTPGGHIVFVGAAGIAVRLIAPLLTDKHTDPAVVVVDDAGRHAVALLSGHEGGANELAGRVAAILGAEPVVTTAAEVVPSRRRTVILGIGCSRGATEGEIEATAQRALSMSGASLASVMAIASIDLKRDEPGLNAFARRWHLLIEYFSAGELSGVETPEPSEVVRNAVGTPSVAQAAAILAARHRAMPGLPLPTAAPKVTSAAVTAAVVKVPFAGRLHVVGIGPGSRGALTIDAWEALRQATVVVGYTLYTDIVRQWLPLARYVALPLGQESARAEAALAEARSGERVALVCSGDAGIYGLAGLVFEATEGQSEPPPIEIEVIPGVTAASSAAALLGAPLMADFATISLSDLHVPEGVIVARLEAVAAADMATVLYNPASKRRRALLASAQVAFARYRPPDTPVGLVRNAYRPDQAVRVTTLAGLPLDDVDMFTLVVIGNSQTVLIDGRMVTRRAYRSH